MSQTPDIVVCCAGLATPAYFADADLGVHRKAMDLNYFGVLNTIKAVLPSMTSNKSGHLILVSSAVCFAPMVGYSTYAPSKFALRGLGECLRNELQRYNIQVTMFYPSNMDTPAFAQENLTKPVETTEIEGTSTTFTAEQAAQHLFAGQFEILEKGNGCDTAKNSIW